MANNDPLEALLIESEGIFIVQVDPGEPIGSWYGTAEDAKNEARQRSLAFSKPVYVFRAIARVEMVDEPVKWTEYQWEFLMTEYKIEYCGPGDDDTQTKDQGWRLYQASYQAHRYNLPIKKQKPVWRLIFVFETEQEAIDHLKWMAENDRLRQVEKG